MTRVMDYRVDNFVSLEDSETRLFGLMKLETLLWTYLFSANGRLKPRANTQELVAIIDQQRKVINFLPT